MLRPAARSLLLRPPKLLRAAAASTSICAQCLHRMSCSPGSLRSFSRSSAVSNSSAFTTAHPSAAAASKESSHRPEHYFLSNIFLTRRGRSTIVRALSPSNISGVHAARLASEEASEAALPPHRRRRRSSSTVAATPDATDGSTVIPPDASSLLSAASGAASSQLRRQFYAYLALSKPRLTALIVLTTMASYALFPVDPLLASPAAPTLSALTLVYLTVGTTLSSACANTLNMLYEPAYDRLMSRTRNRPLVRGLLSSRQAVLFAAATGTLGVAALYVGVNPTVAGLGALNIFLYAGVYTPLKRVSVANTWVGAVVGGIPPLMGWAAASGAVAAGDGGAAEVLQGAGGWLLAALLFAWQFPHFNSLSWPIREEYRQAGYKMMCWKYPALNARVALRYSLWFFPICAGLWWAGVTDAGFVVDSSIVNAWLVREAYRFWRHGGEHGNAKRLFWASVWHLPLLLGLAMLHKAGLWKGVYDRLFGSEEELEWEDDEEEMAQQSVALKS